jgi:hypothetical protein
MLDQFEIALQSGLHGRLSPMVMQQRKTANRSTPPPHAMDGSDSWDNWSVRIVDMNDYDDCSHPQSLLERMSWPNIYTVPITPSFLDQPFSCDICMASRRAFIDHNTPDCSQFICFICKMKQPGHFPEDCPERPTTTIPDNMVDWRVFNPTKGIMLWFHLYVFVFFLPFLFFSFSFFVGLWIHARYAWTISHIDTYAHGPLVYSVNKLTTRLLHTGSSACRGLRPLDPSFISLLIVKDQVEYLNI